MPHRSLLHVHSVLLQMIRQNFVIDEDNKVPKDADRQHIWEVRHAGLLGIKYEVAVRSDLFDEPFIKSEDGPDRAGGKGILRGVVEAAILGYDSFPLGTFQTLMNRLDFSLQPWRS